jgi:hypothetical protein
MDRERVFPPLSPNEFYALPLTQEFGETFTTFFKFLFLEKYNFPK